MAKEDSGSDNWRRREGCKAELRGISPWACNIVDQVCESDHTNISSEVTHSYTVGAMRLLEKLAPQCLECLAERRKSKTA
jgi:hypothetical protein